MFFGRFGNPQQNGLNMLGIVAVARASWLGMKPQPREPNMRRDTIRQLVEEGVLLVAPYRPRNTRDLPRIRAVLAQARNR